MPHKRGTGRNPASKNEIDIEKRDKTPERLRIKKTIKTYLFFKKLYFLFHLLVSIPRLPFNVSVI